MTVEMKLGRWRTRDGSEAVVERKVGVSGCVWHGFVGKLFHTWCDNGQWHDDVAGSCNDLIEYLGPLDEPAPAFDARSLQPGDYYVDADGEKRLLAGWTSKGKAIIELSDTNVIAVDPGTRGYPAGPWVEPPKPQVCYLLHNGHHADLAFDIVSAEKWPHARKLLWDGKGFELGEVIKQ